MAKKVLLAEDSLTIQKVFDLTFKQSDVSLTMVDSGADVIRLAGEISPGLVVVDVSLPDMEGFEVASALREAESTRSCPILILAGTLPPFDEEKYRRCGANGVLFKPFESQELIDKVEALLRSGEEASAASAGGEAPVSEEPWDFSDVLEEVEEEAGKAASAAAPSGPELLPGDLGAYGKAEGSVSLGDFDVSLDEIEAPEGGEPAGSEEPALLEAPAEQPAPEEVREEPPPVAAHMEELFFDDAPAAVTDLSPAIEALVGPETMEAPEGSAVAPEAEAPEGPPPAELPPEPAPGEAPVPPAEAGPAAASEQVRPPPAEEISPDEGVLREQFSARAQEILERVAAEAVEKVMWEMMDRLSAEISAKVREAVEAVAWDVIPSTAEALIREEISRIREQAREKPS